jgi:hypothetical protein
MGEFKRKSKKALCLLLELSNDGVHHDSTHLSLNVLVAMIFLNSLNLIVFVVREVTINYTQVHLS